jgi:hypothetical protein
VPALTPSGIRAFDQAVGAVRSGRMIEIAIEGCDAGGDFSNGSTCLRRVRSIARRLAENGVRDPQRLISEFH